MKTRQIVFQYLHTALIPQTVVEPPNTPMNADKTKRFNKKTCPPFGVIKIISKPLIYPHVSAFTSALLSTGIGG